MPKLPLILSIVALLCATGLGIAAKGRADQKNRELASTRNDLRQSQATLVTRTGELGKANENLAAAGKEIEARGAEVATLTGDVKAGKDELAVVVGTVKAKDDKIVDLENENKELGMKLDTEMAAKVTLEAQLAAAQKDLAEKNVAYNALNERLKETESQGTRLTGGAKAPSAPPANLTGTVRAVNEGLNFLVLNVGDRQGVSVHTSMLVVRGGQRVATLKVTSIEPRESIAEVVPGTLAKGQSVQVGDRVVLLRGERKTSPVVPTSAPSRSGRGGVVEPALPEA